MTDGLPMSAIELSWTAKDKGKRQIDGNLGRVQWEDVSNGEGLGWQHVPSAWDPTPCRLGSAGNILDFIGLVGDC